MVGSDPQLSDVGIQEIQAILATYPRHSYHDGPAEIVAGVYLGDYEEADSFGLLADIGITHVLNCAPVNSHASGVVPFPGELRLRGYLEIAAEDIEGYDITQHFTTAFEFIANAMDDGGKVLVYCAKGRNRSAAVCVGYLMNCWKVTLATAVKQVSAVRGRILTNTSFVKQLYELDKSVGGKIDVIGQ